MTTGVTQGSSANKFELSARKEVAWGVFDAGNLSKLRITGEDLRHRKETAQSQELRSDRQIADLVEVGAGAGGPINFELSYGVYDEIFESLLTSAFPTPTLKTVTATFVVPGGGDPDEIQATNASVDFTVGQHVRVRDSNNNDDWHLIIGIPDANTIQVPAGTLTGEVATANVILDTCALIIGGTPTTFSLEKHFTDVAAATVGKFVYHHGAMVGALNLQMVARRILAGDLTFVARDTEVLAATKGGGYVNAPTHPVMNATAGIGGIKESGIALTTGLLGLNLSINGNVTDQPEIGNRFAYGLEVGSLAITGTADAYYKDGNLYKKQIDHEYTDLEWAMHDRPNNKINGNTYVFSLKRIQFSDGGPAVQGINTSVRQRLAFQAILDPTTLTTFQIERYPATV